MPDTVRTRADLVALLADNTAGDISAQDMRDLLASVGVISSGAGAPVAAPSSLFESYIDTTNSHVYLATGTAGVDNWQRVGKKTWRGAAVNLTATKTGVVNNQIISWDQAIEDTDSFWSIGNPTRLTVPSGISRVRLFWGTRFEGTATGGSFLSFPTINAGNVDAFAIPVWRSGTTGQSNNQLNGFSRAIPVNAGDYFELTVQFTMSGLDQILALSQTYFEIEAIEY